MAKKAKRIPKTVAGVKVPKELRKAGERLLDEVQRPETQAKIAGVLTMAAGAVAAAAARKRAEHAASPPPPSPVPPVPPQPAAAEAPQPRAPQPGAPGTQRSPDLQVVADALGQAAERAMSRFFAPR